MIRVWTQHIEQEIIDRHATLKIWDVYDGTLWDMWG